VIGELLVLAGATFTLLGAIGTIRFEDVFARMHALSKASGLGLLLVLAGGAVTLTNPNDVTFIVLAGLLHLITSPVGSNLISRATYYAEGIHHDIDTVDELAAGRDESR
jgi:multicomponent Na+:H+ antiporter subunit G